MLEPVKKYKNLHVHSNSNTHSKILICDGKWAITCSFNWLSYDGSDERQETSMLAIDEDVIHNLMNQFMKNK